MGGHRSRWHLFMWIIPSGTYLQYSCLSRVKLVYTKGWVQAVQESRVIGSDTGVLLTMEAASNEIQDTPLATALQYCCDPSLCSIFLLCILQWVDVLVSLAVVNFACRRCTETNGASGFGFELTFRLRREPGETAPPTWPAALLQALARYVFQSGQSLTYHL